MDPSRIAVGAAISISAALPDSIAGTSFDSADSPILMFNGRADPIVDHVLGAQTATDLSNAGIPVIFEPLEGGGHVRFADFGDAIITQSVYFCFDFLDLAHAAGQPVAAGTASDRQTRELLEQNPALKGNVER